TSSGDLPLVNAFQLQPSGPADAFLATVDPAGISPPVVTVTATDAQATEGDPSDTASVTLTRTGDLSAALTVNFTLGGTAGPGDYTGVPPGSVTFAVGQSQVTLVITAVDDNLVELTEELVLTLTSGSGYVVGPASSAKVDILDNDLPPALAVG